MTSDLESDSRPHRHRPVHPPVVAWDNRSVLIFLTVCTKDRARLLATQAMHQAILDAWRAADHWLVGRYVVLPDHIHLFCAPAACPPHSLLNWVRFWKAKVAKTTGCGAEALWQKNFWDTQLRRGDSYAAKWEYVRNNPVRHGLVDDPRLWPFQGEMHALRWHD